jgi:serine/threonine-protein kinase RsbW
LKTKENHKPKKLTLTISSKTEQLLDVRKFISDAAKGFGFSDDEINNIVLAVDEACTNIIKHAYNYSGDHTIFVVVKMNQPEFEILIADKGKQFNPNSVVMPDMQRYLQQYKKGGLGMYLMKKLMDKVEYRIQPTQNVVRMIKYLQ